jgi:dihydropteroate synthase
MANRSAINSIVSKPFTIMGIVNVTPDSFYDGGRYSGVTDAVSHALILCDEGADILDIGGASSRPGASEVSVEEELRRVIPVIVKVSGSVDVPISVDTTWARVAEEALDAGAVMINDISAGRYDKGMAEMAARRKCEMVLMHSRGTQRDMHENPHYDNVIGEVKNELTDAITRFTSAGVDKTKIVLDPGIGFSKTAEHNIELLKRVDEVVGMGFGVVIGTSRKSFVGKITGRTVGERLPGTLASVSCSFLRGVRAFRVHDVKQTRDFLQVLSIIENKPHSGSDIRSC